MSQQQQGQPDDSQGAARDAHKSREQLLAELASLRAEIVALQQSETALQQAKRKQTEAALQQQMERERLITAIIQHMRETLDLADILNRTVTELRAFLQSDRVLIYQLAADQSGRVVAEAVAPEWNRLCNFEYSAETCPLETRSRHIRGYVYRVTDRDRADIPACMRTFLEQIQVRAELLVPIVQQETLWGLLIVHQCRCPREWQLWESNLLEQLADQLAGTIQQSELYQQLQTELQERQQIEVALRQSEAEFRLLSDNSPIGIFRTDARGHCTYTNPRYQDICDCSPEAALGYGWLWLLHPEDRAVIAGQWTTAVSQSQSYAHEIRYIQQDGSIRYCQLQAAPLFDPTGKFIGHVGTVEDITVNRAIAQMKNEFISVVSHELRTPLTALRGSLGMLANGVYDNKPAKGKRMLQIAAESADRLARLVSDILDLERLESGKVTLIQQSCDAGALMLQAIEALQTIASQDRITLSVTTLNVNIWVAPDSILQTLINLLSNAIKFSEPGSTVWLSATLVEATAEMEPRSTVPLGSQSPEPITPPYVQFSVKDHGRGIPTDKLETVFGQFQQVDASDSRQKGGTGLGLAICRSIVQQHGGKIWAESLLGQGSTFYFTLPLPPTPEAIAPN